MPPEPSGDTISYGPRRVPAARGIRVIQLSLYDLEASRDVFRGSRHQNAAWLNSHDFWHCLTGVTAVRLGMAVSAPPDVPPDVRQLATELADAKPMRRGSLSERM